MSITQTKDLASRLRLLATIGQSSSSSASQQYYQRQAWLLPDNSLLVCFSGGTLTNAGSTQLVVMRSTNWNTSQTPTWTLEKQLSSTSSTRAALWWDATNLHLHCVFAGINATTSTNGLFYWGASYSSGTLTWDTSATTIIAASSATSTSCPSLVVDSNQTIWVSWRNYVVATTTCTIQVASATYNSGTSSWNAFGSQFQGSNGSSSTGTSYYGSLSWAGNVTTLVTVENGANYYGSAHPDSGAWGSIAAGPSSYTVTSVTQGPHSTYANASGVWVSLSSNSSGTKSGLQLTHFTTSGNTVTWSGTVSQVDSSTGASALAFCLVNSTLYGFYQKSLSSNNSDIYSVLCNAASGTWSSPTNLTNSQATNCLGVMVPRNFALSSSVMALPLVFETGTASPFLMGMLLLSFSQRDVVTRLRVSAQQTSNLSLRMILYGKSVLDFFTRMRLLATVGNSANSSPLTTYGGQHAWVLPDGSCVLAYSAGSDTTYGAGNTEVILIQSTSTWQTSSPSYTFVKQLSSSNLNRVALWWDGANNRLHCVMAPNSTTGGTLTYLSGTYTNPGSGYTWTWDSSATTLVSSVASNPSICVDANGTIFVAYRNNNGSGVFSIQCIAKSSGTWQSPFPLSNSSSSSSAYGVALTRAGTNTVAATFEAGTAYGLVHPDSNAYNNWFTTGGQNPTTGLTTSVGTNAGPVSIYGDSSSSAWVSLASSGTTNPGLWVQQFTFTPGTSSTLSWQGTASQIDSTNGASAVSFTTYQGVLYLFYAQTTSSGVTSDILYATYNGSAGSWNSPIDLTNNAAGNNVLAVVPGGGTSTVLPVFFQTGTSGGSNPIGQWNLVQSSADLATRLRLAYGQVKDLSMRLRQNATGRQDWKTRVIVLKQTTQDLLVRMRLATGMVHDLALRLCGSALSSHDLLLRLGLTTALSPKDLALRLLSSAKRTRQVPARLRLLAFHQGSDLSLRFFLQQSGIHDLLLRLRQNVVLSHNWKLRLLLKTPTITLSAPLDLPVRLLLWVSQTPAVPAVIPQQGFAGPNAGSVPALSPKTGATLGPYSVNGVTLDTQPVVATAPQLVGNLVPAGSSFTLIFSPASLASQALLVSGTTVSMTFALADGRLVTGNVTLTSVLVSGVFQVTCTVPAAIPGPSVWMVNSQFA